MNRDIRLDLMRGYAMLAIALNHVTVLVEPLGFTQQNIPTLTAFGYSSAATLFFALSGYMVGLVYLRRPGASGAIWNRVRLIYLVNAAAFFAGLLIVSMQPAQVQEALGYSVVYESPGLGIMLFLAMLRQPALLDVLHMYVILMLVTPAFAFLLTKQPSVALMISAGTYTGVLLLPGFSYPGAVIGPGGEWGLGARWNMEVLSWQLLFFSAMYAGTLKLHDRIFTWLEASGAGRGAVIALFAAIAAVKVGEHLGYWGTPPLTDKRNLEPLRLLHAGLKIMLLSSVVVMLGRYLDHPLARLVGLVGRQTLYGFAASLPATYVAASFWVASGGTYLAYLVACVFVLAVVIIVSWPTETIKRSRTAIMA